MMPADLLEGVTERSTKAELWTKMQELIRKVQSAERKLEREEREKAQAHTDALTAMENRIREKKSATKPVQVQNVIITSTVEELVETAEWFDDFKDLHDHFPVAVQRLIVGTETLLGRDGNTTT